MFVLPNKKIEVKFIPRDRGIATGVAKNHVMSGGMLNHSVKRFSAPLQRNGSIKNVLSAEEKEYLEKETELKLSVYNEDFWVNRNVALTKEDNSNIFDLSDPSDYISYKILLANNKTIAPTWGDRNKSLTYIFAITDDTQELVERKSKRDVLKEAMRKYFEIENNKELLFGIARMYDNHKKLSEDTSIEFLQDIVEERMKQSPKSFLSIVGDGSLSMKALILKGVASGVLNHINKQYETAEGIRLCEGGDVATLNTAAEYLSDNANRELYELIEGKINMKIKAKRSK